MTDNSDGVHTGLTAMMAWLAFRLATSADTFSTSSSFDYMSRLASQHSWAITFLIVANVGFLGLVTASAIMRLASVLVVATAHGVLAGCLLMADANIWSGTYAIIAGMGYYLAYRRSRAGL